MSIKNISKVTNTISGIAQQSRSTLNKINALVSTDSTNSSIRDRYTRGFYGDTTQFVPKVFSRLFDEPTYLTFRIEFDFNKYKIQNLAKGTTGDARLLLSQNYIPRPFLSYAPDENNILPYNVSSDGKYYSSVRYLAYALGETKRADMLSAFIESLKDIEYNYSYYFTEVTGLNNITRVSPETGRRIISDGSGIITINCMEGLDLKITQLMQLYRKIVWDDVYQRWILPDMMRYFDMKIYVSEMRLFHTRSKSASSKNYGRTYDIGASLNATSIDKIIKSPSLLSTANSLINTTIGMTSSLIGNKSGVVNAMKSVGNIIETAQDVLGALKGNSKLCDNAINDVMPTMVFNCEMCEFDISSTLDHLSSIGSSKANITNPSPALVIKVGNVKEEMWFPLQKGLEMASNNRYNLNTDILSSGKIFTDTEIANDNTFRSSKLDLDKDFLWPTSIGYRMSPIYNGKTGADTTENSTNISREKEAYDPMSMDKLTAVTALTGSVLGVVFSDTWSEAIDGKYTKDLRNQSSNNKTLDIQKSSATNISDTQKTKINNSLEKLDKAQQSEAIYGGYVNNLKGGLVPQDGDDGIDATDPPESLRNAIKEEFTVDEEYNPYASSVVDGEYAKILRNNSTPQDSDDGIDATKPTETLRQSIIDSFIQQYESTNNSSTATSTSRKIGEIINDSDALSVLSAATSVKTLIKYIDDSDIIKSAATNNINIEQLKSFVLEEALLSLAQSTATDKDSIAVKRLASLILDNARYKSTATNLSNEQIKQVKEKSGFAYLN